MDNNSNIKIFPLTSTAELCYAAYNHHRNTDSLDEIADLHDKCFLLGYGVEVNGELKGFSYSLKVPFGDTHFYTLDGYNYGVPVFTASKAGKMVCADLFRDHTDIIYTAHYKDEKHLHALVKRIGFEKLADRDDLIIFCMRK